LQAKTGGRRFWQSVFEQHSRAIVRRNRYSGSFDACLQRERQV
jgi:hypothetical protein